MLLQQGGETVLLLLVREPSTNTQVANIADKVRRWTISWSIKG